jgi:uncharacterized heparinase superfamily protein
MSRHERITPGPGRALVRSGDGAGASLIHRIAQAMRLSRRAPIRLLAVPRDPIAGDKGVGAALLQGRFLCGVHDLAVEELGAGGADLPSEAAERLHSFAWLRDLGAAATHERGRKTGEAITRAWLDGLPVKPIGPAWRPDLWGRRILFWTAYAPYLLASRDQDYRTRLLRLLVRGAQHVERCGDKAGPGLARISAWSGAVAAALVVQGPTGRLSRCESGLGRAIRSGLSDDGGLLSRAPHEQLELIETLALLRAAYATTTNGLPDWLQEAIEGSVSALLCVTLGDAGLSSWQGGNPADPHRVVAALEGAGADARPLRQARGWGYQRLQAKETILVLDAAPPPSARSLAGGSASTLAFELSDGTQRLVVNCGGAGEMRGQLPDELVQLLRTTAAHSTLTLGDCNSTAIHADGSLGRGVGEVNLERGTRDGFAMIEASHDGYVRRFGLIHQRQVLLAPDGKTLNGQDVLIAPGKAGRKLVPFIIRFHLAPAVEVTSTADGRGALLRVRGQKAWQFRCRGGLLAVEDSLWLDGRGMPRSTLQLAVSGESPAEGMTISWELKRAS